MLFLSEHSQSACVFVFFSCLFEIRLDILEDNSSLTLPLSDEASGYLFFFLLQISGNGLVLAFNPVTGAMFKDIPSGGLDLGYKVIQAQLMTDSHDENFLKGVLLVDPDIKVRKISSVVYCWLTLISRYVKFPQRFTTG